VLHLSNCSCNDGCGGALVASRLSLLHSSLTCASNECFLQIDAALGGSSIKLRHGKSGVRTAFDSIDVLELLETDESFSLLKLDIEGSELVVLQRLLQSKNLPKQILVEFDFVRISNLRMWSSFVMLLFQLKSRNYKVFSQEGLNISMVRDSK
jgi:hypothetical protein